MIDACSNVITLKPGMYLVAKAGTYKFNITSEIGDDIDCISVDVKNVTGEFELGHDLEATKVYLIKKGNVEDDRVAIRNKGTFNALNIEKVVTVNLDEVDSYCKNISMWNRDWDRDGEYWSFNENGEGEIFEGDIVDCGFWGDNRKLGIFASGGKLIGAWVNIPS